MERILIIDFGSQVTQLIARRVRENGVYSEIHPFNKTTIETVIAYNPKGIILSGGPSSVHEKNSPRAPQHIFDLGVPILGICYGQQTLCEQLGGKVAPGVFGHGEFGHAEICIQQNCPLFDGVWDTNTTPSVWMSHGDKVVRMPKNFAVYATSKGAPYAITADINRHFYGVQFHPEVVHTPDGSKLIGNFLHKICGCANDWTMGAFRDEAIKNIQAQVGDKKVICGLSGGGGQLGSCCVATRSHWRSAHLYFCRPRFITLKRSRTSATHV